MILFFFVLEGDSRLIISLFLLAFRVFKDYLRTLKKLVKIPSFEESHMQESAEEWVTSIPFSPSPTLHRNSVAPFPQVFYDNSVKIFKKQLLEKTQCN